MSGGGVGNAHWQCIHDPNGFEVASTIGAHPLCRLRGLRGIPNALDATADGSRIAAVDSAADAVEMFDAKGHMTWSHKFASAEGVDSCICSFDGSVVVVGSAVGSVIAYDSISGRRVHSIDRAYPGVGGMVAGVSHYGLRVTAISTDNDSYVVDLTSKTQPVRFVGHTGQVVSAVFSPDDSRVLTASADGTVRLWDPKTGAELLKLGGGNGAMVGAVFNNDGTRIYSLDAKGDLAVYRLSGGR
ncbi:MAG: WD40 repeat domain-containing protein [Fimbriimonadaceae bacterium]